MGTPYVYQPLESPDQFRLVKLLPGIEDEPLHVELHTYHLDKAPSFDALSLFPEFYGLKDSVNYGEYKILVGPKLYHILGSLRCTQASRLLWIGSISVNLGDGGERSGLEQMMGQFYRAAVRTLVCITHDNIQSLKNFMKYTQRLNHYRRAESHLSDGKDVFRSTSKITYQDLQEFEESVIRAQHGLDTSGVDELLKQPSFTGYAYTSNI